VVAQGADEFLHRAKPAAHRPSAPFPQIPSRPARAVVLPEGVEGFLEHPCPDGFQVILEQIAELGGLPGGEVARAFQKAEARFPEDGFVASCGKFLGFLAADFIDRFEQLLGDVEAVEDVERGGQHGGDDVEVGLPHVGADHFDLCATLRSQGLEKAGERCGVAVFDDAEETAAAAVDLIDEGHVSVAFAVGDLIDPDGRDALQIPVFQAETDDPFHGAADVVPACLEAFGGFFPAQAPGPGGEEMAVGVAAGMLALRPRDGLDLDAALRAIHPAHGVGEKDGDVPDGDELELARGGHPVVAGAAFPAAGADGAGVGPGDERGDDAGLAAADDRFDRLVNEALERVDFVE